MIAIERSQNINEAQSGAELLNVKEVAARLKCSTKTVYRMVDDANIPTPTKVRGLIRFNRLSIDQWIQAGCPRPVSEK